MIVVFIREEESKRGLPLLDLDGLTIPRDSASKEVPFLSIGRIPMTVELTRCQKGWATRRKRYGPSGFSKEGMRRVKEAGGAVKGRKSEGGRQNISAGVRAFYADEERSRGARERARELGRRNKGRKHGPTSEETKEKQRQAALELHRDEGYRQRHHEGVLRGPDNPNWKGGRILHDGYVYLLRPDHPHATGQGYVKRSRLVMEGHLGRYLEPAEVVHHEGERDDDRVEMLVLFPSKPGHNTYHRSLRNR